MKQLALPIGIILLVLSSCADQEKQPIITFDQSIKGAYVRLLSETSRDINLFDVSGWSYTYSVEFVDLEQGSLISEYNLDVTFRDNNPDNGISSGGPLRIQSFSSSDFVDTEDGFKGLKDITITSSDLTGLFNITLDELGPGDQFIVNGSIITSDGAQYSGANSTAAVNGNAFQGHFDFNFKGVCPSNLAGTYETTVIDTWCGQPDTVGNRSVTFILKPGTTSYEIDDFSLGAFFPCYGEDAGLPLGNLTLTDICNQVSISGSSQWGEIYTWHRIDIDGTDMEIEWSNDYGEGGTSILHNPSGWPPLNL